MNNRRDILKQAVMAGSALFLPVNLYGKETVAPICHKILGVQLFEGLVGKAFLLQKREISNPNYDPNHQEYYDKAIITKDYTELLDRWQQTSNIPSTINISIENKGIALKTIDDYNEFDRNLFDELLIRATKQEYKFACGVDDIESKVFGPCFQINSNRLCMRNRRGYTNKVVVNPKNKHFFDLMNEYFFTWEDSCKVLTHPDVPYNSMFQIRRNDDYPWDGAGTLVKMKDGGDKYANYWLSDNAQDFMTLTTFKSI